MSRRNEALGAQKQLNGLRYPASQSSKLNLNGTPRGRVGFFGRIDR